MVYVLIFSLTNIKIGCLISRLIVWSFTLFFANVILICNFHSRERVFSVLLETGSTSSNHTSEYSGWTIGSAFGRNRSVWLHQETNVWCHRGHLFWDPHRLDKWYECSHSTLVLSREDVSTCLWLNSFFQDAEWTWVCLPCIQTSNVLCSQHALQYSAV